MQHVRLAFIALQSRQELPLPPVHVVVRDNGKQRLVAFAPLVTRHPQRPRYCGRDGLGIIGVDQQGAPQIDRSSGESRQNQNSRIIRILGGNIFLCNEVHAVAQRGHQSDARNPV